MVKRDFRAVSDPNGSTAADTLPEWYRDGTPTGSQPNSLWVAPRNNPDASINYDITDNLQVGLDASNIMGSRYRAFNHAPGGDIGTDMNIFANSIRRFDRTIAMTARYRY